MNKQMPEHAHRLKEMYTRDLTYLLSACTNRTSQRRHALGGVQPSEIALTYLELLCIPTQIHTNVYRSLNSVGMDTEFC